MGHRFEGHFRGQRNSELFYQSWKCEEPRGTFILTHGLAEHSECYEHLAEQLLDFKWNTFAWDLRGHGRSEGKRGYVTDFGDFILDLTTFVPLVREASSTEHLVLFGHSLGGLITLKTYLDHPELAPSALCLSSPALGLAVNVPKWKAGAAKLASRWAPKVTMWNEISYSDLHRDEERLEAYARDPLRHDKISPELFLGMLQSFEEVRQQAKQFKLPMLFQVSGNDRVVDTPSCLDFFEHLDSAKKDLHIYNESLHEVFNDVEKERVIHDLKTFLNQNL